LQIMGEFDSSEACSEVEHHFRLILKRTRRNKL
jgi:hypothetical protein